MFDWPVPRSGGVCFVFFLPVWCPTCNPFPTSSAVVCSAFCFYVIRYLYMSCSTLSLHPCPAFSPSSAFWIPVAQIRNCTSQIRFVKSNLSSVFSTMSVSSLNASFSFLIRLSGSDERICSEAEQRRRGGWWKERGGQWWWWWRRGWWWWWGGGGHVHWGTLLQSGRLHGETLRGNSEPRQFNLHHLFLCENTCSSWC